MNKVNLLKLIISLSLPLAVGAVAGIFTAEAIPGWYASLNSPVFNPPNWVFGPVWTLLYILMGVSFYNVWVQNPSEQRNKALIVYFIQLGLNFIWSFLFFYLKNMGVALFEISLLWAAIFYMIMLFMKVKPIASYLNIPYILWVSFAAVLNAAYFVLN